MDIKLLDATLTTHLSEMRQRLDQAAGIAKAAEACAEAGNIEKRSRLCSTSSISFTKSRLCSMPRA